MNTDVIEKSRQQFVKASEEFNFTFISPYSLDEKNELSPSVLRRLLV